MQNRSVTVVIPAHNEANRLPRTLRAIVSQTYLPREVIVVNNASSDRTRKVAASYGETYTRKDMRLVIIDEPRRGIAHARNTGFQAATQPIIASTDSDTIVSSDWVERIISHFARFPSVAVVGHIIMSDAPPLIRRLTEYGYLGSYFAVGKFVLGFQPISTANCAVLKRYFDKTEGFDRSIIDTDGLDDVDIASKLSILGSIAYDKSIVAYTSFRRYRTLPGFVSSTLRRLRNAARIRKAHGIIKKGRIH